MKKLKTLLSLLLTMMKIGVFTFGGGYAMIALLQNELVEKKKWIERDEFLDMVAIAESTPGPIAINAATYIGYKRAGFLGSLFATVGVVIPSFTIIFAISLFFETFMSFKYVAYAFQGIQVCVTFLVLMAGVKMFFSMKKTPFNLVVCALTIALVVGFSLSDIGFSSVYFILAGGIAGISVYLIGLIRKNEKKEAKK